MQHPPSDTIVFFGATGDLAFKQIFPALYGLVCDDALDIPIVGVARSSWSLEQFCAHARESLKAHGGYEDTTFARFARLLRFVGGDYADPATFTKLRQQIPASKNPLHYLAIPPALFATVAAHLAASGLAEGARLIIEKPFGQDRASAAALNETLRAHFPESALFRIDHYLGKEPVQNIL